MDKRIERLRAKAERVFKRSGRAKGWNRIKEEVRHIRILRQIEKLGGDK